MAHNYVINSITASGLDVIITGSVDGFPVQVSCPFSSISALANATAVRNFLAPLMLAQLPVSPSGNPTVMSALGSFTQ